MVRINYFKIGIFLAALLPSLILIYDAYYHNLGADPQLTVIHFTGLWALRMLMITLAMSPCYQLFSWSWCLRCRRLLGLFALFYAILHVVTYFLFILGLDLSVLLDEIVERPYITIGAIAILLMIALGVTSPKAMMRKMGRRWKTLHKSIYIIALLVIWHYYWSLKLADTEMLTHGCIVLLLLSFRLAPVQAWMKSRKKLSRGR